MHAAMFPEADRDRAGDMDASLGDSRQSQDDEGEAERINMYQKTK